MLLWLELMWEFPKIGLPQIIQVIRAEFRPSHCDLAVHDDFHVGSTQFHFRKYVMIGFLMVSHIIYVC